MKTLDIEGVEVKHLDCTLRELSERMEQGMTENSPHTRGSDKWSGGTAASAVKRALEGDSVLAAKTVRFMNKLHAEPLTVKKVKRKSVVGPNVNVIDAYKGVPNCVSEKRKERVNSAPLSIVYECTVSAGVRNEVIERRGAAILALVKTLSSRRQVNLWVMTGGKQGNTNYAITVKVPVKAMNLAAFALISPAMSRRLGLTVGGLMVGTTTTVHWADNNVKWHGGAMVRGVMDELKLHNNAVNFDPAHLTNTHFKTDASTIEWLEKQIAEHTK